MLLPYLWNPSLGLGKEEPKIWKELRIFHEVISKEAQYKYLSSLYELREDRRLQKLTTYNLHGEEVEHMLMEYTDEFTEITHHHNVRNNETYKDSRHFNERGLLIKHVEETRYGGIDKTTYEYDEKDRLLNIAMIDEDGDQTWEKFIYLNDQLFKIETSNSDGLTLFRGFIYHEDGKLEKMIRMQNELIDVEQSYLYNEKGERIREMHQSVNRNTGKKNMLMSTEWDYHENGKMKLEIFRGMDSYKGKTAFDSKDLYDEKGLLMKSYAIDNDDEKEDIYEYIYAF